MSKRRAIVSGSTFEDRIGYARAVVDGDWVHVSGTTGFDYSTMTISDDVVAQAKQCLANIGAALTEAGAGLADVVRVRYLLPERADLRAVLAGAARMLRRHPPGRHDAGVRARGPPHAHRDRGDRAPPGPGRNRGKRWYRGLTGRQWLR
jgi:enamine deaminase RidA (YjgF/YER057c/UK114 family)